MRNMKGQYNNFGGNIHSAYDWIKKKAKNL